MSRLRCISVLVLWVLGPLLLWLSLSRDLTPGQARAARVPKQFAGFEMTLERETGPRMFQLLGTQDVIWRDYRAPDGSTVHVTAVFHEHNWKSLHPPQLCIRGSNFVIEEDGLVPAKEGSSIGRVLARSERNGQRYLSLYAFVSAGLCTGSYSEFFWHHAPRALFRRATAGYLLRIETPVGAAEGDLERAEARCRACLEAFLPLGRELLAR